MPPKHRLLLFSKPEGRPSTGSALSYLQYNMIW